jgi:excisionase family DNA binding protein
VSERLLVMCLACVLAIVGYSVPMWLCLRLLLWLPLCRKGCPMSPYEIDALADRVAERVAALMSRPSDDALIDVHAVAELLGCSVPTVERLTKSGELPSVKIGRLRRYHRSVVLNRKGGPDYAK